MTPVIGGFRGAELIAKAVPQSSFEITLRYLAGGGSEYAASFDRAAARWRKVVIGDMPGVTFTGQKPCGETSTIYPALDETVDDVLIFVRIENIDGAGKTLAQAGPCVIRANPGYGSGIPIVGFMRFDLADLPGLAASGRLDDVILHEMGHVLGLGGLWGYEPFFDLAVGLGGSDPYFRGPSARAGFTAAGGGAYGGVPVPIENQGAVGAGTRDGHWRESALDVELMTGFVEPSNVRMPLSLTTVGALEDMGYLVTPYGDDRYRFGEVALITSTRRAGASASGFEFLELPAPAPIAIDRDGNVRPLSSVRFWTPDVRRVPARLRLGANSRVSTAF